MVTVVGECCLKIVYVMMIGMWSDERSISVFHVRLGNMEGEENVMSGDVGDWLACIGSLVGRFL